MKAASRAPDYLPPRSMREDDFSSPTEMEVQALWFEQLYPQRLRTDNDSVIEIMQPGFWNHTGGPDFHRAVIRFLNPDGSHLSTSVGNVEVHLRPADWHVHGHDANPAYDETILHVVWEAAGKPFFPATSKFRRVPQVVLEPQLVAPWPELRPLCRSLAQRPLPGAAPGRCAPVLGELPPNELAEIFRAAGMFRLRQKAQRGFWRRRLAGPEQALFEALAEALGFHANQIPMRLVAQRLGWKKLRSLEAPARLAHLFGLSGFLPEESLTRLQAEPRAWLRELWEIWWKERGLFDYALLPRSQWRLAGLRPLNRPERRLAALARLVPLIPDLHGAIEKRDGNFFAQTLLGVRDSFWEKHATLGSTPLSTSGRLIGEERVRDMLINIFWPQILLEDPDAARRGLEEISAAPSGAARVAAQRMLVSGLAPKQTREALIQQGLLQVYRDYCQTDCSNCQACTFPELVKNWRR